MIQDMFNDFSMMKISVGRLLRTADIWTGRAFQIYAHLRMAGGALALESQLIDWLKTASLNC